VNDESSDMWNWKGKLMKQLEGVISEIVDLDKIKEI